MPKAASQRCLQPADSYESHVSDTERGGAGLCDHEAVEVVIKEGPQRVLELLEWGANFDKKPGNAHGLAFTREGGPLLRANPPCVMATRPAGSWRKR